MATITGDSLTLRDLEGLDRPERLLELFSRLQAELQGALNGGPPAPGSSFGGLTVGNFKSLILRDKELICPDDWVPLVPVNGFADAGETGSGLAVKKTPDGVVRLREVVQRAAGAPADGTRIASLPPGHAPAGNVYLVGFDSANALASVRITSTGEVQFRSGNPTDRQSVHGDWVAADRTLPEWATPLRVRVDRATPRTIRHAFVLARSVNAAQEGEGLLMPGAIYGARIEPPSSAEVPPMLVVPRIEGLRAGLRYRLTICLLLE